MDMQTQESREFECEAKGLKVTGTATRLGLTIEEYRVTAEVEGLEYRFRINQVGVDIYTTAWIDSGVVTLSMYPQRASTVEQVFESVINRLVVWHQARKTNSKISH